MFQIKLHVPGIGRKTISRKGIANKLQNIFDYRLTMITAPAGYGKTTAAAGFLLSSGLSHAWLSLDPEDNDPVRFWQYLIAAVAGAESSLTGSLQDLTVSRDLIESNILAGLFIDQLYSITGSFVLVLDDYHLIQDTLVWESLAYFIKYKPLSFHVIILTRQEQDGRLEGLYTQGQALRLGRRELVFNADEIKEFYEQRDVHLKSEELSLLEARTEGWVAGLVLASLLIEEGADVLEAVGQLSGGSRHLDRYFRYEVFDRWPGDVKEFLVRTSILERLSGPLCRAVTGRADSAELLQRLAASNSFIIPLDHQNEWFRYHHLFAEFLKTRLEQEDPFIIKSLYGLSGGWFEEHGLPREAIEALIKAEDFEKAGAIFGDYFAVFANNAEFPAMAKWLASFPEAYIENNVRMCSGYAWVLAMQGHMEAADDWNKRAVACFRRISGQLEDVKERNYLQAQVCIAWADNAIRHLDAAAAARCYSEASQLNFDDHILSGELNSGQPGMLKTVYGFYGRLNDLDRAVFPFVQHFPRIIGKASAYSKVILLETLYERNQLRNSYETLALALEEAFALGNPGAIVPCFITLAKIRRAKGDLEGALNTVAEGKKKLQGRGRTFWEYLFDLFTARLHLDRHDLQSAGEWLDLRRVSVYDDLSSLREFEHLVFARYLTLSSRHDEAILLLNRLHSLAEKEKRLGSRIEILCLMAVVCSLQENADRAVMIFNQALQLGMEHGYVRTFIDELDSAAGMLAIYLEWKKQVGIDEYYYYAQKLYELTAANFMARRGKFDMHVEAAALTRKERKILQLLSAERSNLEIAGELGISVRTVKYHNSNLFGKLGAKNRVEAIYRARALGLLD